MRCELAAAFLHRPPVVYLDEPTIGLDVAVKVKIRKFIREMNRLYGTTVILTTHDMQDIEEICNRIIIIDEGNIIFDGDLSSIKKRFSPRRVIHFEMLKLQTFELPFGLVGKVEVVEADDENRVSLSFHQEIISSSHVISEVLKHYEVIDLTITDPKIETIVEEIYNRGLERGDDLEKVLDVREVSNAN